MKFQLGDYVQVIRTPDPWEGSGESLKDRESYLEHIGIVVGVENGFDVTNHEKSFNYYYDMITVRFHCCSVDREEIHQRNIESFSLRLVARPYLPISPGE